MNKHVVLTMLRFNIIQEKKQRISLKFKLCTTKKLAQRKTSYNMLIVCRAHCESSDPKISTKFQILGKSNYNLRELLTQCGETEHHAALTRKTIPNTHIMTSL